MTKEMYVSSTPHETKVAIVEDDQLAEIFFERENEYTLAGSIYKGRVTRVLPGMQSAFVDIGLERDAFLYVSDFLELPTDEDEEFGEITIQNPQAFVTNLPQPEPRTWDFQNHQGSPEPVESEGTEEPEAEATGELSDAEPGIQEEAQLGQPERGFRNGRRRRRGRRGRGFPESKFAGANTQPEPRREYDQPGAEHQQHQGPIVLPGESISKYQHEEHATPQPVESPKAVAEEHVSDAAVPRAVDEPRQAERRPVERRPESERRYEPIILPGESLAKYQRAAEPAKPVEPQKSAEPEHAQSTPAEQHEQTPPAPPEAKEQSPVAPLSAGTVQTPPEQPPAPPVRTHVEPIFTLPGESISKYQRKEKPEPERQSTPAAPEPEQHVATEPTVAPEPPAEQHEVEQAPMREARVETRSRIAPFVLPGESIAKYRRTEPTPPPPPPPQPEEKLAEEAQQFVANDEPIAETLQQQDAAEALAQRADSNEPPEVRSETLAESREPSAHESADEDDKTEHHEQHDEQRFEQMNVASVFGGDEVSTADEPSEFEDVPELETHDVGEPHEAHEFESRDSEPDFEPRSRRTFEPSDANTLEEEEIDEDEAEFRHPFHFDDDTNHYEEMEEETLEAANGERIEDAPLTEAVEESDIENAAMAASYETEEENGSPAHYDNDSADADADLEFEEAEIQGQPIPGQHPLPQRDRGDRFRRGGRRGNNRRPMRPRREPRQYAQISDLLKEGQEVLIQIAKEPIGKKGARITSHIALPGRFLVYMPTVNHIGVSRKINSDEERMRLKRIMISEREGGHGGFIVRTAAEGVGEEELRADIRFLKNLWADIRNRTENSKPPALIYHDLSVVERVLRDQVTDDFSQIWVDTESQYEDILNFAKHFQPSLVRKIKLYTKNTPLFEQFNIQEEINKALKSKVWLKSGGYIVINQTEALVAIDVNTGKYVGKTARLEDTIVKTNVDAIKEIVRQVRLRDLGGIIVIDFIDMDERRNRQKVMQALEEALKADRAPSKVLAFNDFGLVAITRKRVKQSMERTLGSPCPYCTGTGFVKSVSTICNEIYTEMRKMAPHLERNEDVMLRVNPEVAKALKANGGRWLQDLEEITKHNVIIKSDALLHQEQFDIH
jgi:ribonuclease G